MGAHSGKEIQLSSTPQQDRDNQFTYEQEESETARIVRRKNFSRRRIHRVCVRMTQRKASISEQFSISENRAGGSGDVQYLEIPRAHLNPI